MTTGECIRAARKKANMTQAQLAEASGVAAISIHQYESGKRKPRIEQLKSLAAALGVDWVSLTEEDDLSVAPLIWEELRESLRKSRPLQKMSDVALYRAGVLEFRSEEDRIAYFYQKLTDEGKLASGVCFYQHLDKESLSEVADYVMNLSENPLYRRTDTPQSPPAPQEGKDTTPAPDAPEPPPEGE